MSRGRVRRPARRLLILKRVRPERPSGTEWQQHLIWTQPRWTGGGNAPPARKMLTVLATSISASIASPSPIAITIGKLGVVPRLITYRGDIERTVCPFCANTHEELTPKFPRVLIWVLGIGVVLCALCAQFGL